LILAFWVVSLSGIVLVAVMAGRASQQGFDSFVNDVQYKDLVDHLAGYYSAHGSFTGAEYLLQAASQQAGNGLAKEYVVVDPQGNMLLSLTDGPNPGPQPPGGPSPNLVNIGIPIDVGDKVVALLIPIRLPKSLPDMAAQNLQQINMSLFIGAVFATVLALALGWIMARSISQPLSDLNEATRAIAQGDLDKQVPITSKDEIGALAGSFNAMTGSLKRSRDLRRQMVADIAHELRNPLSIILGHAEALSEGVLPATPETLDIIYDEARHLSRLVEDLRTLSLAEAGQLSLQREKIEVGGLLSDVVTSFSGQAEAAGISLEVAEAAEMAGLAVMGDAGRLDQVLSNLVANALHHTPRGGKITLSAGRSTNGVCIRVADNGSGISAEDLPFIFERFWRGDRARENSSGLGLAIARQLVQAHGGTIAVESQPERGTTFTIELPGGERERAAVSG